MIQLLELSDRFTLSLEGARVSQRDDGVLRKESEGSEILGGERALVFGVGDLQHAGQGIASQQRNAHVRRNSPPLLSGVLRESARNDVVYQERLPRARNLAGQGGLQ